MEVIEKNIELATKKPNKKKKWMLFWGLAGITSILIVGSTFAILEANSKITMGAKGL
ncbi:MAG: hypothetical protein ACRDCD_02330 [Mycoplasmoidaceae bacterium]